MKLLWLSHFVPYPPAGGALQRSYHLLRHAARQHEVHLIALNQPRLLPRADLPASVAALSQLCASVEVFDLFAERSAAHRAMNMALSVASSEPFDVGWLHSRAFHEAVERRRSDRDLALVHADTTRLIAALGAAVRSSVASLPASRFRSAAFMREGSCAARRARKSDSML